LATTNDTNIWITKFPNANVHSPPQEIINCIEVEPLHIGMSTTLGSNNFDTQYQILPIHEFQSLLQ
jgi:hypothetical protein